MILTIRYENREGPFLKLFVEAIRKRAGEVRAHSLVEGDVGEPISTEASEISGQSSAYPS